jgi:hypothetical protein
MFKTKMPQNVSLIVGPHRQVSSKSLAQGGYQASSRSTVLAFGLVIVDLTVDLYCAGACGLGLGSWMFETICFMR